jgi:hypothetical protein
MMLRPRDDDDQRVLEAELKVTPAPSEISWTRDSFGNHVAIARFAERASEGSGANGGSGAYSPLEERHEEGWSLWTA